MVETMKFLVQVHNEEPSYFAYDFRGSKTPVFVYQDMQRTKAPDLSGDRLVLDLGANIGLWAFRMAKMYPECHFVCYEPFPENIKHFKMGMDENKLENVELIPCGVTGDGRAITLYMDPTNSGSASMYNWENAMFPQYKAQTVTLQSAIAPYQQVDALKIDIEGCEFDLFKDFNAWERIKKVFLEVHPVFLPGDDDFKLAEINRLITLLRDKLGKQNVFVDCTDEKFRQEIQ